MYTRIIWLILFICLFSISIEAQNETKFTPGLNINNSIGGAGYYKENATDDLLPLMTCVFRSGQFHEVGASSRALFCPQLPREYSVKEEQHSWTGKTITYKSANYDLTVQVRSTLPGPIFATSGKSVFMRWMVRNEPRTIEGLKSGEKWGPTGVPSTNDQVFIANSSVLPTLIVVSQPLDKIIITSNRHWEFKFKEPGGKVMYIPLLDIDDVPKNEELIKLWIELVKKPPLQSSESFCFKDDELLIRQNFANSVLSPIPPVMSLYGEKHGLQKMPADMITLCKTLWGPYNIVKGNHFEISIKADWTNYGFTATRKIEGELSPLPNELAYAGDYTWDPENSPMDQLLALRTWAPLVEGIPADLKTNLLKRLKVPSPSEFKASLAIITEPVTKFKWAKDKTLFDHQGDVTFDIDWYNGLTLSGLERAVMCDEKTISNPAKILANECKTERTLMVRYYQLFHEWFIGSAWNDSRGWLMDLDCGHNGIEGLLAESRLCEMEGDNTGAEWAKYLAIKTGVFHMSTMYLREWRLGLDNKYVIGSEPGYGIKKIHAWVELGEGVKAADKKQYFLAADFPEFSALYKYYGPKLRLDSLANDWQTNHPERYTDWIAFYIGKEYKDKFKSDAYKQEARIQAAAFYGIAPEIFLRLWTLNQSPDEIERLYKTPISLSQQLHLRMGTVLIENRK